VKSKLEKPELQIIISFSQPEKAVERYKERWQIETAFRALKSSGFNIEDTHLSDAGRIEKLFSLFMVAFTGAYLVGIYLHQNVKQIKGKKHGNMAKSLFRDEK
jgi:transposase